MNKKKKQTLLQKGLKMIGGKTQKQIIDDIVELKMANDFFTTGDTIDDFQIANDNFMNGVGMILFYDPGCPHCEKFMNTYKELPKIMSGENIAFGRINVSDELSGNRLLSDYFNIVGVPTIYFKNKGYKLYEGSRDLYSLIHFVCNETGKCKRMPQKEEKK